MTALLLDDVQAIVRAYLAGRVTCATSPGETSPIACALPIQYPSGESVTIWIERLGDRLRLSDYGEAFLDVVTRQRHERTAMNNAAEDIAWPWGVEVKDGSLLLQTTSENLGEAVWRISMVAHQVAQAVARFRPPRSQTDPERYFIREVEDALRERNMDIEPGSRREGESGHFHKVAIYVTGAHAALEPVRAPGVYSQISSVYMKFGDLSRRNGTQRFAVVDDRDGDLSDDLAGMLVQVSNVVRWTARDVWMDALN